MNVFLILAAAIATAVTPVTIPLTAQNDSHEIGTAMLAPAGDATRITIAITGEPRDGVQPANIHVGSCAAVAQVRYILQDVRDGRSTTVVPVPLAILARGSYVIVLQGSPASLRAAKEYRYVSCGAIGGRSP
ncbi:MAG: hypothetical protein ACXWNK_17590 [Vulcanimicrobiaceae bacterium]